MLIFLDIETTGLEEGDTIVSLGLLGEGEDETYIKYELVNEHKKISSEASSINHITNEMLKGKPSFKESEIYAFLQKHNNQENTLVAHNINFVLGKISKSAIRWRGALIDTSRVTKHLIPECEHFSLQFLRYELKLYKDEPKVLKNTTLIDKVFAHHALGDAVVVKLLYEYLLQLRTKTQMMELSFQNVLLQKLDFGKYKDRYIEDIMMQDIGYLQWMLANVMDLDEDLRYSINYYLEEQA